MIEEEKKQRQFQATPCPNFSQPFVLERATLTATRPAPFQLSCVTRGLAKKDKFVQQLEQMRLEEQKAAEFKVRWVEYLVHSFVSVSFHGALAISQTRRVT